AIVTGAREFTGVTVGGTSLARGGTADAPRLSNPNVTSAPATMSISIVIATTYRAAAEFLRITRITSASATAIANPCHTECTSVHPSASTNANFAIQCRADMARLPSFHR